MKAKKSLGQNFLRNQTVISEIIEAAEITKGEIVLEIGPGQGILTKALLEAGANVWAIEKDFDLVNILQKSLGNHKKLKLVHQDAFFFDLAKFKLYKVVANLPFNIASPLIRKFLESPRQPTLMVVMVQEEIAQKILAQPGDSERGVLTLAVEFYASAESVAKVTKNNFYPVPKVDARVIKIKPKSLQDKIDPKAFFKIVKAGFSSKRQQIHNSLAATFHLEKKEILEILKKAKIDLKLRAEDLSLDDWRRLYFVFQAKA